MRISLLFSLAAALMGAQSAPPRKDIPTIAKAANGAVVSIIMSDKNGHPIAQGSGFLISNDGRIVTNYHVIKSGTSAIANLPDGAFFVIDGVLAVDKNSDIAILKAHGTDFRTVTLGDSDNVQIGEEIVAIGNPLSLESTVSNGIISGIRNAEGEGGKFLQVTAPISPGSSGGPLLDMAGDVVGIITLHLKDGENLNFAIPINEVKRFFLAKLSKVSSFPNEPEFSSQIEQKQGSDVDLKTTLHWIEVISENSGWRPSTLPRPSGAIYIRERNSISPAGDCSVTVIDKYFVLKNESDALSDETVPEDTSSAIVNLTDMDPSRIGVQATNIDGFPVWSVYFPRSDDKDQTLETTQWKGKRSTRFVSSFGLNFQNQESATRFAKALRHAVDLCGGKSAPF